MLKELVEKNRSYRGYDKNVKVSDEQLTDMISHARICSAGQNKQAIRFIVSNTKEKNDLIFAQTNWAMALGKKLPFEGEEPTAYIVLCVDSQMFKDRKSRDVEIGISAQTILLRATEMGLGGCMIGAFNFEGLEKALDIPERYMTRLVLALGKPIETVVLTDCTDENYNYYRDENNVHYVPKLTLDELILDI